MSMNVFRNQKVYFPSKIRCRVGLSLFTFAMLAGSLLPAHAQSTPFPLGGYLNTPNGSDPVPEAVFEGIYNSFTQLMGTTPQFMDYYVDQTQPVSSWPSNASWSAWSAQQSPVKAVTPVIGFPMTSTSNSMSADQQYRAFASGQYDSYIQGVVQAWQSHGFNTQYWRPGWEMNLDSMPSYAGTDSQTQADWISAFQHISTVLRQAGANLGVRIQVIWNPSVTNYDLTLAVKSLYPGNSFVDIIGADIYADMYPYSPLYDWDQNNGTIDSSLAQWMADPVNRIHYWTYPAATPYALDGSNGHNLSLQVLLNFAKGQGKPFAVPETGAGDSSNGRDVSDEAAFPTWLAQTLHASGITIAFVNIWDADADGNFLFSTSNANKPGEAAAWTQGFGTQEGFSSTTWYNLVNQTSHSCVDGKDWGTSNGTLVQQWNCGSGQANQEWQLQPVDSGFYSIVNRNAPAEVIDVEDGGTINGQHMQLWQYLGNSHQQWMPVSLGNGFYKFISRDSGRCLDTPAASTANGVQLQIYDCNGTGAQAFQLVAQP